MADGLLTPLHRIRRWGLGWSSGLGTLGWECYLPHGRIWHLRMGSRWHFQLGGRMAVLWRQRPGFPAPAKEECVISGPRRSGLGLWPGTIWVPPQPPSLMKGMGYG